MEKQYKESEKDIYDRLNSVGLLLFNNKEKRKKKYHKSGYIE